MSVDPIPRVAQPIQAPNSTQQVNRAHWGGGGGQQQEPAEDKLDLHSEEQAPIEEAVEELPDEPLGEDDEGFDLAV
jgi:hypothetical protein